MSKYKLINGLISLSSAEWKEFDRFLRVRCNSDTDVYKLFLVLKKHQNKLDNIQFFSILKRKHFSSKTDKQLLNTMSKLNLHLEDFIVYIEIINNKDRRNKHLIIALNKRGLYALANQYFEERTKHEKSEPQDFHQHAHHLYDQLYFSDNPIKYNKGIAFLESLSVRHMMDFKEKAVFNMIELINFGNLNQYSYTELIEQYRDSIANIKDSNISELGSQLLELYETDNLKILYTICNKVFERKLKNDSTYNALVSFYLIIYISKAFNQGTLKDVTLGLNIYNYALETKVLMKNGEILPTRFINMISAISAFSDYESVIAFINKWNTYLNENERMSFTKLAEALSCMYFNRMDKISVVLRGVNFTEAKFRIRARTLELLSLFESRSNNYNLFYDNLNNVKRQLNRNKSKLSSKTYMGYKNFINVLELLSKRDFAKVKIQPLRYKNLMYRSWVIDQLKKVKD